VSGWPRVPLGDLVIDERPQRSDADSPVWNLNLDQIEPDSGRILERVRVPQHELGPSTYPFAAGTVLYSKLRPYLNKVVVADGAGYATTELVPLRCNPQKVLPLYLAYFLRSAEFLSFANTVVAGAKMPRMVMSEFWKYQAPLPSLAQQCRIATILDKADALRTKRREALAQLECLAQSIFVEMFGDPLTNPKGWPVASVGEVADVQGGLQVTSARKNLPVQVPYLRVANVYRGRIQLDEVKTIRATANEVARTKLVPQDMLVVEGHGNPEEVGRGALWGGEMEECVHQNHLIRVRFDLSKVAPAFVCEYLNSPRGRQHLLRAGKTTSGLNTISVSNVRAVPIALPPLEAQKAFEQRLREVGRLKTVHQSSFEATDALFTSLQASAFRGEL